ncbi:hypothetical protein CPB85DRAFT_1459333, partial [Mucidula mucida]
MSDVARDLLPMRPLERDLIRDTAPELLPANVTLPESLWEGAILIPKRGEDLSVTTQYSSSITLASWLKTSLYHHNLPQFGWVQCPSRHFAPLFSVTFAEIRNKIESGLEVLFTERRLLILQERVWMMCSNEIYKLGNCECCLILADSLFSNDVGFEVSIDEQEASQCLRSARAAPPVPQFHRAHGHLWMDDPVPIPQDVRRVIRKLKRLTGVFLRRASAQVAMSQVWTHTLSRIREWFMAPPIRGA